MGGWQLVPWCCWPQSSGRWGLGPLPHTHVEGWWIYRLHSFTVTSHKETSLLYFCVCSYVIRGWPVWMDSRMRKQHETVQCLFHWIHSSTFCCLPDHDICDNFDVSECRYDSLLFMGPTAQFSHPARWCWLATSNGAGKAVHRWWGGLCESTPAP